MRKRSMQYVQSAVSTVSMRRNKFDLSHGIKTSMNVGTLYPIDIQEVLPGDTFISKEVHVSRLSTAFLKPVMDNVWLDVYHFFVPLRLLYDEAENVFGIAEPNEYVDSDLAEFPSMPQTAIYPRTVADYMGLPVAVGGLEIPAGASILPFRAFAQIYNDWFRNENVQQSVFIQKGEYNPIAEAQNQRPWGADNYTGEPPKITKKKDYFTACLPAPQKGEPIELKLVDGFQKLPVVTTESPSGFSAPFAPLHMIASNGSQGGVQLGVATGSQNVVSAPTSGGFSNVTWAPDNLVAMLGDTNMNAVSVNDLRFAFQAQKMLEKDARYGTRYREYILGHFGVSNADARMQVSEFLGGHRTPLNITAVSQTSAQQGSGTPLASQGALSHSVGSSRYVKSFTEHGYVITVAAIRQLHTYQQGIEKFWFRKERNDFYDPLFANLGEQPVYEAQLFGVGSSAKELAPLGEGDIFGYQEYGAEYRYRPSYITGQMRSYNGTGVSFDVYHFGDFYQNAPTLSPDFINETSEYFDRTVAADSDNVDNFLLDFWFDVKAVRVMPLYSTPGLVDHH